MILTRAIHGFVLMFWKESGNERKGLELPQGIKVDGAKIRAIRKEFACLSQTEAAKMAGLSIPGLWKIETKGRTTLTTLRNLADVLGVHPSELLAEPSEYAALQAVPGRLMRVRPDSHSGSPGEVVGVRRVRGADPQSLAATR